LPLKDNLGRISERLKEAEYNNNPVIIIVDPWSLLIRKYFDYMRQCDILNLFNCYYLIPFNKQDPQTTQEENKLRQQIERCFTHYHIKKEYINVDIKTKKKLKKAIKNALEIIRKNIRENGKIQKKGKFRNANDKHSYIPQPMSEATDAETRAMLTEKIKTRKTEEIRKNLPESSGNSLPFPEMQ